SYNQIIWEPENEPAYSKATTCPGGATVTNCMPVLAAAYQSFINQARADGDVHWIIIQNVCSFGCSLTGTGAGDQSGALTGWPTVTDPISHLFYSMHAYLQANNSA